MNETKISVKLTKQMRDDLEKKAMLLGLSMSTYARMIIVKELYKKEGKSE